MSLGLAELSCQERLDEVPGDRRSDGPAAHAEDVQVIVLDTLSGREMVVDQLSAVPGTLLAQTDAPTPLPQIATPRSTFPPATAWASGTTKSG